MLKPRKNNLKNNYMKNVILTADTSESSLLELSDMDDLREDSVDLLDSDEEDSDESFGVSTFGFSTLGFSTFGVAFVVSTFVI